MNWTDLWEIRAIYEAHTRTRLYMAAYLFTPYYWRARLRRFEADLAAEGIGPS